LGSFPEQEIKTEEETTSENQEGLTALLRRPSLRSAEFKRFVFTGALCQAMANALEEGSTITDFRLNGCYLPEGGITMIAKALRRNATVTTATFNLEFDKEFLGALAALLLSNSTIHNLTLELPNQSSTWLSSNFVPLWRKALSFLRTSTTVTSLSINIAWVAPESFVSTFLVDIAAVLEENSSLEHLTMNAKSVNVEDYLALVSSLQEGNTTLETLHLVSYRDASGIILEMTDDEVTQLTSSIKMNYGLEALPDIDPDDRTKYLDAILRLNRAGRRYLAKDGSSISKGVEVLSAVSDDLNCVFLHLSENPRLCDRSAIEKV
jgi:hypothetical protein